MTSIAIARGAHARIFLRAGAWAAGVGLGLTLVAGVLHSPVGRPLLAKLGIACPVRAGTPDEVDRARAFGAERLKGKSAAPARPALGFTFERTTLADLDAWAAEHHVSCAPIAKTPTLRSCSAVPAQALGQPVWFGPAEEVSFEFRASGTLASVSTMRRQLGVPHANAMTADLSKRLHQELSVPHITGGENRPEHFAKSPLQAFKEEWLFGDYGAILSEVRLANTGLMVREQYLSSVP